MGNLVDIQQQIEKLQKQASDIRTKEFDKTVKDILAQMQAFGITLKDLQQAMGKGRRGRSAARGAGTKAGAPRAARKQAGAKRGGKVAAKKVAAKKGVAKKGAAKRRSAMAGVTVAPKYRGPGGETWSGRGLMPKWLSALVAQGRTKEEFAIPA